MLASANGNISVTSLQHFLVALAGFLPSTRQTQESTKSPCLLLRPSLWGPRWCAEHRLVSHSCCNVTSYSNPDQLGDVRLMLLQEILSLLFTVTRKTVFHLRRILSHPSFGRRLQDQFSCPSVKAAPTSVMGRVYNNPVASALDFSWNSLKNKCI